MMTPRRFLILLAFVGLLMVAGFILVIRREQDASLLSSAGGFLLTGLAFLNILLMMVLLIVLFRELVKGFFAWRRQREGARFRTKVLTSFVLLGLVPSLLLFISAIILIESTVDRWFRSPVNSLTNASQTLVDKALDMAREESRRKASALAWQLRQVPPDLRSGLLAHEYKGGDIDAFCLLTREGKVLEKTPESFPPPDAYKLKKIFDSQGLYGWIDLAPKPTVESGVAVDGDMGILVGRYLPAELFEQARFISENNKVYLQIRSRQHLLKISMFSSFLALTLLVTFAAVWIGSRLSREFSIPLQLLLEGTREVAKGKLSHRIDYGARDEIGLVVDSFNTMTRDLETNKRELERRNAELRAATESSERRRRYIETLVETLNIGVISTSPDGQVHTLNSRARKLLGMQPDEPKRNLTTRPEWGPIGTLLAKGPNRAVVNREVTMATRRGNVILSVSCTPLQDPSGNPFGTLVILEDISDLSRAQRIAAWQEAAQRMAHEIKNPLTPIRLSAHRIRKKAGENAPDLLQALEEGCTTIEREVQLMMTMVNEFSRFARLPEVRLKPTSLPALIQDIASPYRSEADVQLDLPPDFPPVRLDVEQMGSVLKNLLENAVQAMEPKGRIRIRLTEEKGFALLSIRDTGPGIPEDSRQRLFTPYFSTKRKGTGLGLAIVTRILEEHGGTIRVDDGYQEGAGFIVTLPL